MRWNLTKKLKKLFKEIKEEPTFPLIDIPDERLKKKEKKKQVAAKNEKMEEQRRKMDFEGWLNELRRNYQVQVIVLSRFSCRFPSLSSLGGNAGQLTSSVLQKGTVLVIVVETLFELTVMVDTNSCSKSKFLGIDEVEIKEEPTFPLIDIPDERLKKKRKRTSSSKKSSRISSKATRSKRTS
ncbi:hypothetical protein Glove_362g81 [Diversispora epigaea]|uniref:Uncharacterized protein n=1 Tax=Diversispora epigaea TaxID=1348612 RepID=A0A397HDP8_9GLOM|nr:hypothetical protein Glove_362g81 [Diversispora epigaea]